MATWNDSGVKESWRRGTVTFLLEVRAAYLALGANPLQHWTQIQNRMRASARTATSVEEWATALCRTLGIGALGSEGSHSLLQLRAVVGDGSHEWLHLVEREYGLIVAMARVQAEARRGVRVEEGVNRGNSH